MTASVMKLNKLVNCLDDKDLALVIAYVEKIVDAKGNNLEENKKTMEKIGELLSTDSVWKSEQEMLVEMANFRRSRMA